MSNDQEEMELDEIKAKIDQAVEANNQAAVAVAEPPVPSPEPVKEPESTEPNPVPVTPSPEPVKEKDALKWAEKKGYKSSEDMARALLQKEQEYHQSKQKEVQPPAWQPRPDVGYQQPYQQPAYQQPYAPAPRLDARQIAQYYPQLAPEDVERVLPLVMDAARAISQQDRAAMERRIEASERVNYRNNELMTLMQDPAFRDSRVQKEVHQILDSDPSIFQRERTPLVYAYEKAMVNMARKQLQQGVSEETPRGNTPPVTAGGGNGSANTLPYKPTEKEIEGWSDKELKSYMTSGKLPKRT